MRDKQLRHPTCRHVAVTVGGGNGGGGGGGGGDGGVGGIFCLTDCLGFFSVFFAVAFLHCYC